MVASAIAAYNAHPEIKDWMEKNIPLFKEAEKFNPFFHGVGGGQAGGILRMPYEVGKTAVQESLSLLPEDVKRNTFVQMMMPKTITNMNSAKTVLALIPALNDLNKILIGVDTSGKKPINPGGELKTSLTTLKWEAGNQIAKWFGNENKNRWQVQGHLPYDVQQTNGWNMRSEWTTKLSDVLNAVNHGAVYIWPDKIPAVGGQKITKESINNLINYVYPEWDAGQSLKAVANAKSAASHERTAIQSKSPSLLSKYDSFVTYSDQIQTLLTKNSLDTASLAYDTAVMRKLAAELSAQDSSFAPFYKRYFQAHYGPLEEVK